MCGISNLIACFILFLPKNKTLFEFLFYAGIIGAIQAFLTPQINNFDGTNYEYSLLKVISKEKVSDTLIFFMSIDPLKYYHKLEEKGISNNTIRQLNDRTYLY